jgi:hypothetical protein
MSIINKPSANKSSLNQPALNRSNQPALNRSNQPVQANTSFIEAAKNNISKSFSSVSKSINAPINESLNSTGNAGENAESYTYIIITIGFLILTLSIVIYFRDQIASGFNMAWQKIKGLFSRNDSQDMPVTPPPPPPENRPIPVSTLSPEIGGLQIIEKSIESNISKLIPKRKEVFNIAKDVYTYSDAEPLCKAYGAELATYDQVKDAWKKGADWCNYGWVKGQTAVYPTQKDTYDKLQAGPEDQRASCGVPGINGGYFDNPELRFGVNCYGTRPNSNEADERYRAANRQNNTPGGMAYDKKVRDFKTQLKDIPVNPFDAGSMAM